MLNLLFAPPAKLRGHPGLRRVWGQELPHVIKEIYGGISSPHEFQEKKTRLSIRNWFRLMWASYQYRLGLPYEYVWGHSEFRGRDFLIDRSVLIPRPETEEWVGWLIEDICKHHKYRSGKEIRILDIGTGSGVIAITLKGECPFINMTAVEISTAALTLAQKNAHRLLSHPTPICFIEGDIFTIPLKHLTDDQPFDIVVTNPPYVGWGEQHLLSPGVVKYEPPTALFAQEDGLGFYRKLANLLPSFLSPQGIFYTEIGWQQAAAVRKLFDYFRESQIVKDMFGKERLFIGRL